MSFPGPHMNPPLGGSIVTQPQRTKKTIMFLTGFQTLGGIAAIAETQKQEPGDVKRVTRLLLIIRTEQALSLDNAWGEKNEQLLF